MGPREGERLQSHELGALRRAQRRVEEAERLIHLHSGLLDAEGELAAHAQLTAAREELAAVRNLGEIGDQPTARRSSSDAAHGSEGRRP